jgi:hypothetical protein
MADHKIRLDRKELDLIEHVLNGRAAKSILKLLVEERHRHWLN